MTHTDAMYTFQFYARYLRNNTGTLDTKFKFTYPWLNQNKSTWITKRNKGAKDKHMPRIWNGKGSANGRRRYLVTPPSPRASYPGWSPHRITTYYDNHIQLYTYMIIILIGGHTLKHIHTHIDGHEQLRQLYHHCKRTGDTTVPHLAVRIHKHLQIYASASINTPVSVHFKSMNEHKNMPIHKVRQCIAA